MQEAEKLWKEAVALMKREDEGEEVSHRGVYAALPASHWDGFVSIQDLVEPVIFGRMTDAWERDDAFMVEIESDIENGIQWGEYPHTHLFLKREDAEELASREMKKFLSGGSDTAECLKPVVEFAVARMKSGNPS